MTKKSIHYLLLCLLGGAIYHPLLIGDGGVNPDAQFILSNVFSFHSLGDYLRGLLSFSTFDFQPVRDLSYWFDLRIHATTGYNSFVLINLFLWINISFFLGRILREYHDLKEELVLLVTLSFFAYPLFTQTVSWGMARKHLLAVFFIIIATRIWISPTAKRMKSVPTFCFYLLSILSHPITLLWPIWAGTFVVSKKIPIRERMISLIPMYAAMAIMFILTWLYYENSSVFLSVYGARKDDVFNLPDKILSIGHYTFQVFFPYLLAIRYTPGHWTGLAGLVVLGGFAIYLRETKTALKEVFIWLLFGALSLAMVVAKSRIYYDTYLVLACVGVVILIVKKFELPQRKALLIFIPLITFWSGLSYLNARDWTDEIDMTRKSFERRPSCDSAYSYLKSTYENGFSPENKEALTFLYQHECSTLINSAKDMMIVRSYILFYDSTLPVDQRAMRLEEYSKTEILPAIVLIATYIKEGNLEFADGLVSKTLAKWKSTHFKEEYIPLVAQYIYPYCLKKSDEECELFFRPFARKKESFYYK